MSSFEFLSVLISVVVGLGIANILTGIGKLIHRNTAVKFSMSFLAWTVFVFFYMVVYWWTVVFGWQIWENWNLLVFMFVLTYGLILYLLSVILFPADLSEEWQPAEHLVAKRHWFYGVFLALVIIETMDSYLKDHLEDFSIPYFVLIGTWFSAGVIGWISRNRRVHDIIASVVVVSQIAWVSYQLGDLEWSLMQ